VPKCEIFDRSDFRAFYTIKSLWEHDFGVKIKKVFKKYLGDHLEPRNSSRACSVGYSDFDVFKKMKGVHGFIGVKSNSKKLL
jgi:hypothetical protein